MSSDAAPEAPTGSGVHSGEATPVTATEVPAATETPATPDSQSSGVDEKMQSAQAALMALLDSDGSSTDATDTAALPSLRAVQKMCMRIPHLSNELSPAQRCRLYELLLLDLVNEDGEAGDAAAAAAVQVDWTSFASRALEAHANVAQQAAAILPATLQITSDELAGLFYHLGAETAFYFNVEMVEVILCFTHVVAGSRATDKATVLHSLYRLLSVLQKDFIVSTASRLYEPATTALLRLMLQFYDPELATHVDQQQVDIGRYLLDWTRRLLVLQSDYETALKVLDWVFILGDPVMIPYVAHAYLITHRQTLLALGTRQALAEHLDTMKLTLPSSKAAAVDPKLVDGRATAPTPVWSGKSLLQNADLLYRATPLSAQRMLDFCLYPDVGTLNKTPEDLRQYYANAPCLPLERSDLAEAFAKHRSGGGQDAEAEELPTREYIVVDCRSKESYEYVRLPTAVLVGDVLSYQPEELATAMERLESCRGRALALFGTGRPIVEEVNLLKVLAIYLVTRKRFPFVCIVPGGFKTTIPLVRYGVIDAVMSPSAAAALASAAPKRSFGRGVDWGQQASDTANSITAALSEVSGYLSKVEGGEVRHRAEELGARAKEGVAAAGSWGWGMMQRLREGLSETRDHAATALTSVASKVSAAPAAASAGAATPRVASGEAGPAPAPPAPASSASRAAAPAGRAGIPTATAGASAASHQAFSLGEDGEEDDLDLITSIPTRPMRANASAEPAAAPAEATPAASAPTVTASTPERQNAAAPAAPVGSPTTAAPPSSSLAAAPATAASSSLTAAAAPRGASASQIAANIDAEFDELFGDLDVPPTTAAAREASAKPAALEDADDPFGE